MLCQVLSACTSCIYGCVGFFVFVCVCEGESNLKKIQSNVQTAIGGNMSLYCLGFGNDVDYSFLDVMSRQNKGLARRIFLGSDAALQLQVGQKKTTT